MWQGMQAKRRVTALRRGQRHIDGALKSILSTPVFPQRLATHAVMTKPVQRHTPHDQEVSTIPRVDKEVGDQGTEDITHTLRPDLVPDRLEGHGVRPEHMASDRQRGLQSRHISATMQRSIETCTQLLTSGANEGSSMHKLLATGVSPEDPQSAATISTTKHRLVWVQPDIAIRLYIETLQPR